MWIKYYFVLPFNISWPKIGLNWRDFVPSCELFEGLVPVTWRMQFHTCTWFKQSYRKVSKVTTLVNFPIATFGGSHRYFQVYVAKTRTACNISNTRDSVSSDFQTPRTELKIGRAAEYFWRNSRKKLRSKRRSKIVKTYAN